MSQIAPCRARHASSVFFFCAMYKRVAETRDTYRSSSRYIHRGILSVKFYLLLKRVVDFTVTAIKWCMHTFDILMIFQKLLHFLFIIFVINSSQ